MAELTTKTMYDLFDNIDRIKKVNHLYEAIDKINATYGTKTIRLARSSMAVDERERGQRVGVPILEGVKI